MVMFKKKLGTKGFTLMEILIVLIIIGVLAAAAVPMLSANTKRAASSEAVTNLSAARQSALRFVAQNGSYATVANNLSNLDFDPNNPGGGQTPNFAYVASNQAANTITITATATAGPCFDGSPTGIVIDQTGTVTGNPCT